MPMVSVPRGDKFTDAFEAFVEDFDAKLAEHGFDIELPDEIYIWLHDREVKSYHTGSSEGAYKATLPTDEED